MSNIRVLGALASSTRRELLDMLRTGPRTVGALTTAINGTQPTVSQHLRVLGEAMLVKVERKGNQRIYHLDSQGLAALRQYVDSFWDRAPDSYQQ